MFNIIENKEKDFNIDKVNKLVSKYNDSLLSISDLYEEVYKIEIDNQNTAIDKLKSKIKNEFIKNNLNMNVVWDDSSDQAGRNKGFVCHSFNFSFEGELIGYLKLIEVKKDLVPNLAHYLAHVKAWNGVDKTTENDKGELIYRNILDNELEDLIKGQYGSEISEEIMQNVIQEEKENFRDYLDEWSRLTVAFVSVESDYQRCGIATKFYFILNDYLKEFDRKIYADGAQTREGKLLWEYFESCGWVKKDNRNLRYFDPS